MAVILAGAAGCGERVVVDGSDGGAASQGTTGKSDTTGSEGSTGDGADTLDVGGSSTGPWEPGPLEFVDCAELPADGNTVAGGPLSPLGFPIRPCDPSEAAGGGAYTCCSDDPAALGAEYPSYAGLGIEGGGEPIFSGPANARSSFGMCVRTQDIGTSGVNDPSGCPVPCNPTWDDETVGIVCGGEQRCCQTLELRPEDCILVDGKWRAVRGGDVLPVDGEQRTHWAPGEHVTHQDPNATECLALSGVLFDEAFNACLEQLGVADQRGFCMPVQVCPHENPSYVDACEELNG